MILFSCDSLEGPEWWCYQSLFWNMLQVKAVLLPIPRFYFIFQILKLSVIFDLQHSANFISTAEWLHILFLTLSSILFHHKWLDMVPCAVIQQDLIAYSVSCYAVEGRSSIGNRGRGTGQNKFRPLRAQPQTSEKGYAMVSWHLFWRPIPASMWMSVSIVQKK